MNTSAQHQMKVLQSSVAMTVTLISFGMLFATLFLGYALYRFNAAAWPPVEISDLPQLLPFLSTLVIGLSSVTYYLLETKAQKRRTFWILTLVLGLGFLALQWTLWAQLKSLGIVIENGQASSMIYAFTWLHAAHIGLGVAGLLWTGLDLENEIRLMNVGKFWHFLGVVWLIMYLTMFVL